MNFTDESNAVKISTPMKSCCKIEIKFISNSSEFESYQKVNNSVNSVVLISTKIFQISNPILYKVNGKDALIFYDNPIDITVNNSSFLI